MPVYNGEAFLGSALESIVEQGDEGIECIVVDDGSSDRSIDVARSFSERLQIQLVEGPRRGNWVAVTNDGLRRATGQYGCFLHQDDLWLPGRARRLQELVEAYPQATLWVQSSGFVDTHGAFVGKWRLPVRGSIGLESSHRFVRRLLIQNFLCIGAPVFRLDRDSDLTLDESLWYTADWDLWLRLAARGDVAFDTTPGVAFRVHPGSQTSTRTAASDEMLEQLRQPFERHLAAWRLGRSSAAQRRLQRTALASMDVNVALAAAAHGDRKRLLAAGMKLLSLGPRNTVSLLRNSRLIERTAARLRVSLRARVH